MGLTIVQVAVYGPREPRRAATGVGGSSMGGAGGGGAGRIGDDAKVEVDVSVAGFVAGERKKRSRGDRYALNTFLRCSILNAIFNPGAQSSWLRLSKILSSLSS